MARRGKHGRTIDLASGRRLKLEQSNQRGGKVPFSRSSSRPVRKVEGGFAFVRPMGAWKERSDPMQTQRPTAEEMTAHLAAARREAEAAMRSTRAKLLEQIRAKGIETI